MFEQNEGTVDRVVRVVVGLLFILAGVMFISGTLGVIAGVVGLVLVITGAIGWCPAYAPFNFTTKKS